MPLEDVADLDTRNLCEQIFTLYYRSTGPDKSEVRFFVVDNFGLVRLIDVVLDTRDS